MTEDGTRKLAIPPVTALMKMAFGLGSSAESIVITTTSSFLLIYYNQVLGLPPEKVGLALSLGLIVNALFDPLVGSWSDRTKSRLGRRRHGIVGPDLQQDIVVTWSDAAAVAIGADTHWRA